MTTDSTSNGLHVPFSFPNHIAGGFLVARRTHDYSSSSWRRPCLVPPHVSSHDGVPTMAPKKAEEANLANSTFAPRESLVRESAEVEAAAPKEAAAPWFPLFDADEVDKIEWGFDHVLSYCPEPDTSDVRQTPGSFYDLEYPVWEANNAAPLEPSVANKLISWRRATHVKDNKHELLPPGDEEREKAKVVGEKRHGSCVIFSLSCESLVIFLEQRSTKFFGHRQVGSECVATFLQRVIVLGANFDLLYNSFPPSRPRPGRLHTKPLIIPR